MEKFFHEKAVVVTAQCNRVVVDSDTGDVVWSLQEGDKIIPKRSLPMYSDDSERMGFTNGAFGKAYAPALEKLSKLNLTAAEYKTILRLMTMVRFGSGLIAYGNYRPISLEWIEKELDFTHRTCTNTMQRLIALRIISKSTSGIDTIYFFNPYIYQRGRYINKTLFEMFKKSEWARGNNG